MSVLEYALSQCLGASASLGRTASFEPLSLVAFGNAALSVCSAKLHEFKGIDRED